MGVDGWGLGRQSARPPHMTQVQGDRRVWPCWAASDLARGSRPILPTVLVNKDARVRPTALTQHFLSLGSHSHRRTHTRTRVHTHTHTSTPTYF